jgi:RNA polymerase sigma factor (sigma-70 family)
LEASALTHASRRGLLARRSPLLKLQGDQRLIAMARNGNAGAFETIVDRYQGRLLGFCRQMLGSTEDAEDVLQEVFVNAYRAMLADEREINLRPWLYRIARNRCLNHLRKPTADAQESMDMVPAVEAASTAEKVHNREEFRQLLTDVGKLPETQRTALLLREMDAMSYEEIAQAMETSVPSVKSLLVRARISLAEASQARQLTCGEVRLELAEAAEGLRKVSGPVRRHVRDCEECADFRSQVRSNDKVLAALFPAGPLLALKGFLISKLGFGGAGGAGTAGSAAGAGATTGATAGAGAAAGAGATAGAGALGGVGAALGGGGAAGGIGAVGGAIGSKAVAGVVTAAAIAAGAVGVEQQVSNDASQPAAAASKQARPVSIGRAHPSRPAKAAATAPQAEVAPTPAPAPVAEEAPPAQPSSPPADDAAGPSKLAGETEEPAGAGSGAATPGLTEAKPQAGAPQAGGETETVVVTVGGAVPPTAESAPPPAESAPPPAEASPPPAESPPPSGTDTSTAPTTSGSSVEDEGEDDGEAEPGEQPEADDAGL